MTPRPPLAAAADAAAMVDTAAPPEQPGTLLWIGTRTHGEMIEAYRQCEATAAQIAVRASVAEAIARPAGLVRRIVIARSDRAPADPMALATLRAHYPQAQAICLLGSGCEGEQRTGQPWPGIERVYWHQWNQRSIAWLDGVRCAAAPPPADRGGAAGMAIVIAARLSDAAPLLDLLQSASMAAVWMRRGQQAATRNAAAILWDDSAAAAAPRQVWQRRLTAVAGGCRPPQQGGTRHLWLTGFPRLHHWNAARRGGIDLPISKPYDADALRCLLTGRQP